MSITLTLEDYSEKSFVVRGNTMQYQDDLNQLGGKCNSRLRDGEGWIFSKTKKDMVTTWIETGTIPKNNKSYSNNADKTPTADVNIARLIKNLENRIDILSGRVKELESVFIVDGDVTDEDLPRLLNK
jgi:hypothetical protein